MPYFSLLYNFVPITSRLRLYPHKYVVPPYLPGLPYTKTDAPLPHFRTFRLKTRSGIQNVQQFLTHDTWNEHFAILGPRQPKEKKTVKEKKTSVRTSYHRSETNNSKLLVRKHSPLAKEACQQSPNSPQNLDSNSFIPTWLTPKETTILYNNFMCSIQPKLA